MRGEMEGQWRRRNVWGNTEERHIGGERKGKRRGT
jgi:hypothetical protein